MDNTANKHKTGLGRGLAAIIGDNPNLEFKDSGFIPDLNIDAISPNPQQPRVNIKPEELIGLADSIREHGVIEPLIVTQEKTSGKYLLVAGERRWRAAKLAQMQTIPAIVREVSPREILEIAVIENIQRKDLNPIEEAHAISELYNNYRVKLEDLAKKLGREISTISNKMRLLKLPKQIQEAMLADQLTESHAYSILALKNRDAMPVAANMVIEKKLSVRQTDEIVRKLNLANEAVVKPEKSNAIIYDKKTDKITTDLSSKLGKGFRLVRKRTGGRMTIPFQTDEQLDLLYQFLISQKFTPKK